MVNFTVCIATRNRAAFLKETLDQLLPQMEEGTETVVVDGGSTDSTPEVVSGLKRAWPNITYVRREEAGGVDRDFALAVETARGEYCWLMADDDLLRPGAVRLCWTSWTRASRCWSSTQKSGAPDLTQVVDRRRLHFVADRVYAPEEQDRLLAETGSFLSFIGCVVIRRDLWVEREKERYVGSEFIHVGVIFQSPLPGPALAIAHPWIVIRYGNAQWGPRSFRIWMFQWPSLIWSFSHTRGVGEEERGGACTLAPQQDTLEIPRDRCLHAAGI